MIPRWKWVLVFTAFLPVFGESGLVATRAQAADDRIGSDTELAVRVQRAWEAAKHSARPSLMEISNAILEFELDKNYYPIFNGEPQPQLKSGLSWRVHLLPYLDQKKLYDEFHLDEAWDSPHNSKLISKMPAVYGTNAEGKTRFQQVTGPGMPLQPGKRLDGSDVLVMDDTILIVESGPEKAVEWTKPGALLIVDPTAPQRALGVTTGEFEAATFGLAFPRVPVDMPGIGQLFQVSDKNASLANLDEVLPGDGPPTVARSDDATAESGDFAELAKGLNWKEVGTALVVHPRQFLQHPIIQEFQKRTASAATEAEQLAMGMLPEPFRRECELWDIPIQEQSRVCIFRRKHDQAELDSFPMDLDLEHDVMLMQTAGTLNIEALLRRLYALEKEYAAERQDASGGEARFEMIGGMGAISLPGTEFVVVFPEFPNSIYLGNRALAESLFTPAAPASDEKDSIQQALESNSSRLATLARRYAPVLDPSQLGPAQEKAGGKRALHSLREVRNLVMSIDLDAKDLAFYSATAPTAAEATNFVSWAKSQIPLFKSALRQLTTSVEDTTARTKLNGVLASLLDNTQFSSEGTTLRIQVERPAGFDDLPNTLAPVIESWTRDMAVSRRRIAVKTIAFAMHNYHDVYDALPAADGPAKEAQGMPYRKLSWRVYLLPYLDELELYREFHLDEAWDSLHNKQLISRMPAVFGSDPEGKTRVHVITGSGAAFREGRGFHIREATDGTSETLMLVEAGAETADFWTKPGGLPFDPKSPLKCLGKADPDTKVFLMAFMDGSAKRVPSTIKPTDFAKMVQYADSKRPVKKP